MFHPQGEEECLLPVLKDFFHLWQVGYFAILDLTRKDNENLICVTALSLLSWRLKWRFNRALLNKCADFVPHKALKSTKKWRGGLGGSVR